MVSAGTFLGDGTDVLQEQAAGAVYKEQRDLGFFLGMAGHLGPALKKAHWPDVPGPVWE